MKKNLVPFVCLLCLFVMAGCGPSLKDYVAQSQNYYSNVSSRTTVSVNIEPNRVVPEGRGVFGSIGAAVNTASAVGAIAVSHEQNERLQKLVYSDEITPLVASGFNEGFANATHLVIVDNSVNPDLRILITVEHYGLWAESILDPMKFYLECEIQIIHTPSMEKIYSNSVYVGREASNLFSEIAGDVSVTASGHVHGYTARHAVGDAATLVSGAANLTAFFELTDEQIQGIFEYMAYDAGYAIAKRLTDDIYR